ncbi:MAG: hypothetical protein ACRC9O_09725, partial [Plesiomonas sp.]
MHRIDTATAQIDKFGSGKNGFTAGNPQTGTPATEIDAAILDSIQEEICGVIEGAKIALAKNDRGQLLKALNFFLDKKLSKDQNGADIPDKELFLQNLQLKDAAKRSVGTGAGQIPDMSSYSSDISNGVTKGWRKQPDD